MKKDKILKSSLSTLLKRFSSTDVISSLSRESSLTAPGQIPLSKIQDNSVLKSAKVNGDKLQRAIQSISEKGIYSPLYVIDRNDYYEVLYPRIIYKAAKKLKFESVPCILVQISDEYMLLFLAGRLLQNKDANIVELSLVFNKIKKKLKYTQKEIAAAIGLSRPQVTNIMRLIRMPSYILDDVVEGKLSFGHVRALFCLKEKEMMEMIDKVYQDNLSVHELEKLVYLKKHKLSFDKDELNLEKKYQCKVRSNVKQITFSFKNEKEKQLFIDKISH